MVNRLSVSAAENSFTMSALRKDTTENYDAAFKPGSESDRDHTA